MIRVLKIGGRAQGDPTLPGALRQAFASGARLCVVHGGGDEVTALQRALGQEPTFLNGRRATTPRELDVVRMVLSGTVNKRLVGEFLRVGVPAVGISGEDGGLLGCEVFNNGVLGAVGVPTTVQPQVLHALMDAGFVPVVSPLGRFTAGGAGCNVNGDDAAAAIAAALGATDLLLVADVPAVLDATGVPLATLDLSEVGALVRAGVAKGGMIAKLEAAVRAVAQGVPCVRIGGIAAIPDSALGTVVTAQSPAARRP